MPLASGAGGLLPHLEAASVANAVVDAENASGICQTRPGPGTVARTHTR